MQTRQANLEGTGEIALRRLVKEALRMRPDRIIVGEVRQEECLDLLISLNSGLPGRCSIHASSAREAIVRLCTLPLLAGGGRRSVARYAPGNGATTGLFHETWSITSAVPSPQHGGACDGDSGSPVLWGDSDTIVAVYVGDYRLGRDAVLCGRLTSLVHRIDQLSVKDWIIINTHELRRSGQVVWASEEGGVPAHG